MKQFQIEAVGKRGFAKFTNEMPSAKEVEEILKRLWEICWGTDPYHGPPYPDIWWSSEPDWRPGGEFQFRERNDKDPKFRVRDFEGKAKDSEGKVKESQHKGLDLLGAYRGDDRNNLVTIYMDSCMSADDGTTSPSGKLWQESC